MQYNPREIERKWSSYWEDTKVHEVNNDSEKEKFYVLDMFPYPSGSGLHVGHPLGYIASDIYARYKRMDGFNVLHPMGFDAFGLPAEQYAIQTGVHPADSTNENIERYRTQLSNLGLFYDWSREVKTCDPKFYKWTQWIFLLLFDHYYNFDKNKACPIQELIDKFNESGTAHINAACSEKIQFSANEWKSMNAKERDDVLMNFRLAYRKRSYVNWCEALGTVLANDEVKDGLSERGGHPVERKEMLQWSLRITAYAERLLNDLENLDWSDSLKSMQRNWIGRSEGATVFFPIQGNAEKLEIYTTRPDTIYGATFMVLAPEHPLVDQITSDQCKKEVDNYVVNAQNKSDRERQIEAKTMTGVFTGSYAINPFTGKSIPIWIADYVLMDYGTGAIMAVPSRDDRDHRFASQFGLEIVEIIDQTEFPDADRQDKVGIMINSGEFTGMPVKKAIKSILYKIEQEDLGFKTINYKLRDANYSRQRYWGEPFPILYDNDGVSHPLNEDQLPLLLPDLKDFKPASGGKSPLARNTKWVTEIPGFTRETDTMPGFAGSSWYFLRYMDANNEEEFASSEALNYWRDVDLYVGGTEHAVGHLMYSRFWHKFLYDLAYVPTIEPFKKLINQGMIQGVIEYIYLQKKEHNGFKRFLCAKIVEKSDELEVVKIPVHVDFVKEYGSQTSFLNLDSIKRFIDWRPEYQDAIFECGMGVYHKGIWTAKVDAEDAHLFTQSEIGKMSKRYFNVINPDDVIEKYGADCFRLYEMFLGPVEQSKPWDIKGIDGVSKFLRKLWSLFTDERGYTDLTDGAPSKEELRIIHNAIKKVRNDIERFSFNTCVSTFMVTVNQLKKLKTNNRQILSKLVRLMAPFTPHLSEELWHYIGSKRTVNLADYPHHDEQYLAVDAKEYPISINGKKRATAMFATSATKDEIESAVLEMDIVKKWVDGQPVKRIIVVPGRMVNIVV